MSNSKYRPEIREIGMGSEIESKDSAIAATLSVQRFRTFTADSIVSEGSSAETTESK